MFAALAYLLIVFTDTSGTHLEGNLTVSVKNPMLVYPSLTFSVTLDTSTHMCLKLHEDFIVLIIHVIASQMLCCLSCSNQIEYINQADLEP